MHTAKIAGLYAASRYAAFQSSASTDALRLELQQRLRRMLYNDDVEPGSWHYNVSISTADSLHSQRKELDFFGERVYCHLESYCSARVLAWARQQVPAEDTPGVAPADRWLVTLAEHAPYKSDLDSAFTIRLGRASDFAKLERGIRAYQRKRQKYVRKLLVQLAAYHEAQLQAARAQELAKLRRGQWLGADKALTTATRIAEPGLPFMGDAELSHEQRQQLHYWAVPEDMGMRTAFPAGTGIALKQVKRSRELVHGAVYLWQWMHEDKVFGAVLGRLDMGAKEHGYLPLRNDDTGKVAPYLWADWTSGRVKLYRVTHYTTRAAAPVAAGQVLHLEQAEVPQEELALAA